MKPRIESLVEKKLVGKRMAMSFSDNRTSELWRGFMPRLKEIRNSAGTDLYSIEIYPPSYWSSFSPDTIFEKWAAMEVTDFRAIPEGMEIVMLPTGLYAVFVHKGPASAGPQTYGYIFQSWLPETSRWITGLISRLWGKSTRIMTQIQKKKYGYRSDRNNQSDRYWLS